MGIDVGPGAEEPPARIAVLVLARWTAPGYRHSPLHGGVTRRVNGEEPMQPKTITLGTNVRLATDCPIDFEGAGPVPGEAGRIVALSGDPVQRDAAAVSFERLVSPWIIPTRFLEQIE